jgi:molybdate transport system regulatory protein
MSAGPLVRFRIDFSDRAAVGPGKIELLEAIGESGSLSQAARNLGMSYRRAWLLVASLNSSFRRPVARAVAGGRGGGGATLTDFGRTLIETYRALDREISSIAARHLQDILPAVARGSRAKSVVSRRPIAARRI